MRIAKVVEVKHRSEGIVALEGIAMIDVWSDPRKGSGLVDNLNVVVDDNSTKCSQKRPIVQT